MDIIVVSLMISGPEFHIEAPSYMKLLHSPKCVRCFSYPIKEAGVTCIFKEIVKWGHLLISDI
jgi:hypothetical protein